MDKIQEIWQRCLLNGDLIKSRNIIAKELRNVVLTFDNDLELSTNYPSRKFSIDYLKTEFKWYLKGDLTDLSIANKASIWKSHINKDNTISSNYGHYLFTNKHLLNVANELINDRYSRRAVVSIYNADKHLQNEMLNDIPCTVSLQFFIRNDKLEMTVYMRSNDAWYGLTNDTLTFRLIQKILTCYLKQRYHELRIGSYTHIVGSFHIYEKQFDIIEKIIKEKEVSKEIYFPEITEEESQFLIKGQLNEQYEFSRYISN